jgi:hypothetical protein
MALRLRRGTEAERVSVIFQEGELVYVTDTKDLYAGDGVTPGGIKVSNVGSPDALTQDLDLDGFDIFGSGTVTATAFVGDGSGLTNLPIGPGGIVEGVNYRINIVGNDSSTIVNSATNTLTGLFVGDGSNITNILLEQLDDAFISFPSNGEVLTWTDGFWVNAPATGGEGVVTGGDYEINIIGADSTRMVDSSTNTITGTFNGNNYNSPTDNFNFVGNDSTSDEVKIRVVSKDNRASLALVRTSDIDISTDDLAYGAIYFERDDTNGPFTTAIIAGRIDGVAITADKDSLFPESKTMKFTDLGDLGIGVYEPTEKLDVRGNVTIFGNNILNDGSLILNETRTIASITSPVTGEMTFNIGTNRLAFYDGFGWREIITSTLSDNTTDFPGAIVVGGLTEEERDEFGNDSTNVSRAIVYNTDTDRFEFFQAGSWVTLNNNGTSAGQVLTWDGAKWEATAPATGGSVVSADQLDGFDGPYYLNWNNFTNTPSTLAGYGIIDAALATDLGNFTFTGSVLDTDDSSSITVTPAVTFSSDVTVQNSLTVTNKITVDTLEVSNLITAPTAGTPEISSDGAILLTAATRVEISSSPLKMASFTTAERDILSAENGDMIYNTSTNKFQGYANGIWVDLH